jgi:N-terminal acetyltransferase B complex non-catalytic subunit
MKLYRMAMHLMDEACWNIAVLVVVGLLRLDMLDLFEKPDKWAPWVESGLQNFNGTRFNLQAALFTRHALSNPASRDVRQLSIISTRLHLSLGLGSIAFEHYSYCRVKEMLHDTVSWILLTRISQTHPFDVDGENAFSADGELSRVITAIEKMEEKADAHLYNGITNFSYDTAVDMLQLKRKLRSSVTKHMCIIERRRIARLQGRTPGRDLDLNLKGMSLWFLLTPEFIHDSLTYLQTSLISPTTRIPDQFLTSGGLRCSRRLNC